DDAHHRRPRPCRRYGPRGGRFVIRSEIIGCGTYLPDNIVTNDDIAHLGLETSDAWIRERTGIRERRIVREGETTSHLAVEAARAALRDAAIDVGELDLVVVATTTPDETFPAT